jgi:hypothetical protein
MRDITTTMRFVDASAGFTPAPIVDVRDDDS